MPSPVVLPWVLRFLGPVRGEVFLGQLAGHRYAQTSARLFGPGLSRQPLMHGAKFNFKPTRNLDLGVSVTTIFAGPGVPFNSRTVLRSFGLSNTVPGRPGDPGDRRSGFDFRYRVPGLRRWVTFYGDSFAEDEISPLAFPRRSAFNIGVHVARVPGVPKLDVNAEGFYTDLPGLRGVGFFYYNFHYISGYTNRDHLVGHWIGRQGSGLQVTTKYSFSAENRVELTYRNSKVSPQFITGGVGQQAILGQIHWKLSKETTLSGRLQAERWVAPILDTRPRHNVLTAVEFRYRPKGELLRR
jgi:hypothetical protein